MSGALVPQLLELGLTRNEALAWLTLLEDPGHDGLTGYEVAARSSIPRSAVYGTLRKLELSGGAFATGADPVRYTPTDPKAFIAKQRRDSAARLDSLEESLQSLPKRVRPEPIWLINGRDEVIRQVDTMIRGAERSVYLSLWPREVQDLWPALTAVSEMGLHAVLYCPQALAESPPGFSCWIDSQRPSAKADWDHRALVVIDHERALIGGTEDDVDNNAVLTSNYSLMEVAKNCIILDITLLAARQGVDCGHVVAPMMDPIRRRSVS